MVQTVYICFERRLSLPCAGRQTAGKILFILCLSHIYTVWLFMVSYLQVSEIQIKQLSNEAFCFDHFSALYLLKSSFQKILMSLICV